MDEQQLLKLCFFHWEALAQDAVEQNDIFLSHWKIPGKVEFDAIKTSVSDICRLQTTDCRLQITDANSGPQ